MNTEEFVAEERRTDRLHRTLRIGIICGLVFLLSIVWGTYQCNIETADENAMIEEARARRVEAEQATALVREAAEAGAAPERDKTRYEAHERCLQNQEQARCDELFFPEMRRKTLIQELYKECLDAKIEDSYCDDEVRNLMQSHDSR